MKIYKQKVAAAKPEFKPIKLVIVINSQNELDMLIDLASWNVTIPELLDSKYQEPCKDFFLQLNNNLK